MHEAGAGWGGGRGDKMLCEDRRFIHSFLPLNYRRMCNVINRCELHRESYRVSSSLYTRVVGISSSVEPGNEGDVQDCLGFASMRL